MKHRLGAPYSREHKVARFGKTPRNVVGLLVDGVTRWVTGRPRGGGGMTDMRSLEAALRVAVDQVGANDENLRVVVYGPGGVREITKPRKR